MNERTNQLLIAAAPTPNGRLHLGHIGAQFLKLDVVKRHARRDGGQAMFCFSLDTFDTPIYILAQQQGRTEAAACREYIEGIKQDLENVAIDYDVLLDTSTGEGREIIRNAAAEVDQLVAPRKVPVTEKVAYSRSSGKPMVGRMLTGECPKCGRTIRGYSCDPCGLFLSSIESIRDIRPADPADSLELRDVTNYFVQVDTRAILDYHDSLDLPTVIRGKLGEAADLMLGDDQFRTRWTASVPYGIGTGEPGQVYFNYMLVAVAEQIAFGEMARREMGLRSNPFEADSDTVTVFACGVDNLAPFLIDNVAQTLATGRYRPVHHQLVSEFFTVDGEKISTSMPNALWVADAADLPGFSRDGLRGYLLSVATPNVEVDLSTAALRAFMDELNPRLERVVADASASPPAVVDPEIVALAEKSIDKQSVALALSHIDLPVLWQITEEWIDRANSAGLYSVLAGFAVVASPALPDTARTVWQLLGLDGEPDLLGLRRFAADGH
jgi:methionyl-tRNA synthetase